MKLEEQSNLTKNSNKPRINHDQNKSTITVNHSIRFGPKKQLEFMSEEHVRSLNSTHDNLMLMTSSFGPINNNVEMFKQDSIPENFIVSTKKS